MPRAVPIWLTPASKLALGVWCEGCREIGGRTHVCRPAHALPDHIGYGAIANPPAPRAPHLSSEAATHRW